MHILLCFINNYLFLGSDSGIDWSNVVRSPRTKHKTAKITVSATTSLLRPLPEFPSVELASSPVTVTTSKSSADVTVSNAKPSESKKNNQKEKRNRSSSSTRASQPNATKASQPNRGSSHQKRNKNDMLDFNDFSCWPDYSNYDPQDYSNYQSYDANRISAPCRSFSSARDMPAGIDANVMEKIINTTVTSVVQGYALLDSQKSSSTMAEYDKMRLEKEAALADMAKTSSMNAQITAHEMQLKRHDESLQDQRRRTQAEHTWQMEKEKTQFQFDLAHQAKLNEFKIADTAATNDNERRLKFHNFQTNSQVKLMETTSFCNRNQSIFNQFGNVEAEEEESTGDVEK